MQFTARLRPISHIARLWRESNRVNGAINSVMFVWQRDNTYATGVLNTAEVEMLRTHPCVELVATEAAPLETDVSLTSTPVPVATIEQSSAPVEQSAPRAYPPPPRRGRPPRSLHERH
jgi:hypothetical protein